MKSWIIYLGIFIVGLLITILNSLGRVDELTYILLFLSIIIPLSLFILEKIWRKNKIFVWSFLLFIIGLSWFLISTGLNANLSLSGILLLFYSLILFFGSLIWSKYPKSRIILTSVGIGIVLHLLFSIFVFKWFLGSLEAGTIKTGIEGEGIAISILFLVLLFVGALLILISLLIGSIITYVKYRGRISLILIVVSILFLIIHIIANMEYLILTIRFFSILF